MTFFDVHTHWLAFLIFITLFPRLTMLFTGICFFPWAHIVWFWVGWVITPRFVVAILATTFYWHTNPILCVIAWIICLCFGTVTCNKVDDIKTKSSRKKRF